MACAGVVASAGAQLDFTLITVGARNVLLVNLRQLIWI